MILTIARKELRSLFFSPLAWVILCIIQIISAYLFLGQIDIFLQIQGQLLSTDNVPGITQLIVAPMYANTAVLALLIIPLLTMRTISEERRSQTLPLLLSAPLSMTEIVLGKLFGLLGFVLTVVAMITLMPLSLAINNDMDTGVFFTSALGLTLILFSFCAVGVYISSLTTQPMVAAAGSFGFLLFIWIVDWAGNTASDSAFAQGIHYLSMLKHYEPMLRGAINSSDIVYYVVFISGFTVLTIRQLDTYRLPH